MARIKELININIFYLFVISTFLLPTSAFCASQTFTATQYANIYEANPNTNDHDTNGMWIVGDPTNGDGWGLLKFDISSIPAGSTINTASLTMSCVSDEGIDIAINFCNGYWSTSSVSWNNKPSMLGMIATSNDSGPGTWEWLSDGTDFPEVVQAWLDGSRYNNGLYVLPYSQGAAIFRTSHSSVSSSQRPKLYVTYTEPCTYSISPTSRSFSPDGGSGSINVSTGSGCHWSITQHSAWLSISNSSGNGSGTVTYTVPSNISNTGTEPRTGTITVAGKTHTVYQEGLTITRITITGPTSVDGNSSAQYSCTAYYSDGKSHTITSTAAWSENSSYASINSTGYLTTSSVTSEKNCTITASYYGKTDTHSVTIEPPVVDYISISGPTTVDENDGAQYTCTAHYSDGSTSNVLSSASWSENSGAASINSSGYLSATAVTSDQSCRITASFNGKSDTHDITIKNIPAKLTSIAISGPSTVNESAGAQYTCTARYSDGSTSNVSSSASWSENSGAASINSSGYLSATAVTSDQSCRITASFNGKSDTHDITIKNIPAKLTSIAISGPSTVNESAGAQYTCTARYSDGSTSNVSSSASWSENSGAASINSSGYLSATAVTSDQSCRITASFNGKSDTHDITIKNIPAKLTSIAISGPSTVNESAGAQYTCTARYSDGSTSNVSSSASWSENSGAASINSSGYLSATAVTSDQSCRITASFNGKSDTRDITIKNIPASKVTTPVISPDGGTFANSQQVTLSCNTPNTEIRYTTDGTAPTINSTLYKNPFEVSDSCTIKARGFKQGFTTSDIASTTFAIDSKDSDGGGGCFISTLQ